MHWRRAGDRDDCGDAAEFLAADLRGLSPILRHGCHPEAAHFAARTYAVCGRRQTSRASSLRAEWTILFQRPTVQLPYNPAMLTEEDKQWISERLEKVDTTLLTEFHKWASPVELRQRSHAAVLRALDAEVESLSDRLKNLEGR